MTEADDSGSVDRLPYRQIVDVACNVFSQSRKIQRGLRIRRTLPNKGELYVNGARTHTLHHEVLRQTTILAGVDEGLDFRDTGLTEHRYRELTRRGLRDVRHGEGLSLERRQASIRLCVYVMYRPFRHRLAIRDRERKRSCLVRYGEVLDLIY